jgi:hypothetical protein
MKLTHLEKRFMKVFWGSVLTIRELLPGEPLHPAFKEAGDIIKRAHKDAKKKGENDERQDH